MEVKDRERVVGPSVTQKKTRSVTDGPLHEAYRSKERKSNDTLPGTHHLLFHAAPSLNDSSHTAPAHASALVVNLWNQHVSGR